MSLASQNSLSGHFKFVIRAFIAEVKMAGLHVETVVAFPIVMHNRINLYIVYRMILKVDSIV